jgi:hypothetical protein
MIKHSRKHSSRKSNKNIKSLQTCENVTILQEEGIDTIHGFSKLDISDKSSQSSSCDQSITDQQIKRQKSLSGSFQASQSQCLQVRHSPGITQNMDMDQARKGLSVFKGFQNKTQFSLR